MFKRIRKEQHLTSTHVFLYNGKPVKEVKRSFRRLIRCMIGMEGMKAALTTGAVYWTSMENIKVRSKNDESEKGAIMKQTPPLKKIKALFCLRRTLILEAQRKRWPLGLLAMSSSAF